MLYDQSNSEKRDMGKVLPRIQSWYIYCIQGILGDTTSMQKIHNSNVLVMELHLFNKFKFKIFIVSTASDQSGGLLLALAHQYNDMELSVLVQVMVSCLTHWLLGDLDAILKMEFSILFYWLVSSDLLMIMPSDECHRTLLMISQHWFR